jgi:hypothetical protein
MGAVDLTAGLKKHQDLRHRAVANRKLPDLLPESEYLSLESEIERSLKTWQFLRRSKDPEISEQARKRIRRVWEALHLRLDAREKINILHLGLDYDMESMLVRTVLERLNQFAMPSGRILPSDKKIIAVEWCLTVSEVEEIWKERKKWRPLVRERLARRYKLESVDRLNRLLPISRKTHMYNLNKKRPGEKKYTSLAESWLPGYILEVLSK